MPRSLLTHVHQGLTRAPPDDGADSHPNGLRSTYGRLPKSALEDAVIEQMVELHSDSALIAEALADLANDDTNDAQETEARRAAITQELVGARRALDRYFAAFEEGGLSPADCRERVARLKDRIESLEAEEQIAVSANRRSGLRASYGR